MGHAGWERVVGAAVVVVGGVVGLVLALGDGTAAPVPAPLEEVEVTQGALVAIHVSGWVSSPGVVWVEDGALTFTAIAAAGGALEGARLDLINLALPVYEGDQVEVPGPGSSSGSGVVAGGDGLIDINTAGVAELQELPGVGPVLAERIVAQRESIGRFEAIEDLLDVPGIGEARLDAMRDMIRPP